MKKELDLKFYSEKELTGKMIFKSTAHSSKYENHIRISVPDDVNPSLFKYLRSSYELL